ncbi:hypothetical protein PFAG_01206 [Plasmodium falciparum Santa Lucia]|uniref:Plasmodium falciparum erythrocyte membrane protein 1 acidic terminal segment domain-containing protein n=1 Tax=Plasmodium falciparum Santa Lucia TaxID=478859 RepID=W7G2K5_PLAFA|nr:hypothetical protein PFAG_01206 [Plasmodium falciparum Santa Lucia]
MKLFPIMTMILYKSNDKSCECANKKKIYNHLSSSNKVHDNYLDNLKTGCSEVLGTCTLSSVVTGSYGNATASISSFLSKGSALIASTSSGVFLTYDYDIPHKTSTNRYIPYRSDRYKGRTYIYIEEEEMEDYNYVGDISSSDITSSSESEYEEFDINDIYPYKSPKYKTLIEMVLNPSSKTYDMKDTHIDHIEDISDTTTNKLTDNEWNKLKKNFITQYLNHT